MRTAPRDYSSRSGHVCCNALSVAVASSNPTQFVRSARETRRGPTTLRDFQDRARRYESRRRVSPQRNQQATCHRDDPNPSGALPTIRKPGAVPQCQRAERFPAHPIPRQLNTDRLQPRIARTTNSLVAGELAAFIARRRESQQATNLAAVAERAPGAPTALIARYDALTATL